jgi:hypothetical protein
MKYKMVVFDEKNIYIYIYTDTFLFHFNIILKHNGISSTKNEFITASLLATYLGFSEKQSTDKNFVYYL